MFCPMCGHETDGAHYHSRIADLHHEFSSRGVHLTKSEARLVLALKGRNRPVTRSAILDALYGDRPDGGPDWAESNVQVFVSRIRAKIRQAKLPWSLIAIPGIGYELREEKAGPTLSRVAIILAIALPFAHAVVSRIS